MPWRKFRREPLVLALIAVTALPILQQGSTQDQSRLALTQSILERGTLNIDPYRDTLDKSRYGDHWYTDKAPGLSFVALPAVAAVRAVDRVVGNPTERAWDGGWRRYILRVLVNGPLLLAFALVVGRASEGLVPGTGAPAAVVAGLGTLASPLSTMMFSHVGSALLALGALLLAWRRSYLVAGMCAGAAVLVEYPLGIAAALVALYVGREGLRPVLRYAIGVAPAAAVLGAYNWLAFESPFRLSYQYLDNVFAYDHARGLIGITVPSLEELRAVIIGGTGFGYSQGLLITSPILIVAVAGLVALWARGFRAEAAVCLAAGAIYLVATAGVEGSSYGGLSPGPRYFVPALGLVLLGLPEAFRRWPRLSVGLAILTLGIQTVNALGWAENNGLSLRQELPTTIWSATGVPKEVGVAIVFACTGAAAWVSLGRLGGLQPIGGRRRRRAQAEALRAVSDRHGGHA